MPVGGAASHAAFTLRDKFIPWDSPFGRVIRAAGHVLKTMHESLAWLTALAARQAVGDAACLRRSLLVYGLLRRRGLLPVLQLGIGPHVATFRAHAWIELEGTPLLDSDAMFRPFVRQATPSRMR